MVSTFFTIRLPMAAYSKQDPHLSEQSFRWSSSATRNPNSTSLVLNDWGNLIYGGLGEYRSNENAFIKLEGNGVVTQDNGATLVSSDFDEQNKSRRLTLDDDGNIKIHIFDLKNRESTIVWLAVQEMCTVHGTYGDNAICIDDVSNTNPSSCVCPPGFKNNTIVNESNSCVIKTPLNNNHDPRFQKNSFDKSDLKVQNFSVFQSKCLANPNCLGFGFKYDGKGYCVLQINQLRYGYRSPGTETAFFLRVHESETDEFNFTGMTTLLETTCAVNISLPVPPKESSTTLRNLVIICTLFAAELISGVLFFWGFLKKYIKYRDMARSFDLEFLPAGELGDHRVVAVKCLKNVTGGDAEFWAEVTIIARMHHLNLVRLWGFCAEKGQKILVYEHVPNGSLDKYLFPASQIPSLDKQEVLNPRSTDSLKPILDWNILYRIALGVARAIAYLHEECLEWVLHCDIKPENILLGEYFCPKISDFGLAKLRKKEDMVSMSMARGTRGYMAPEWLKPDPVTPKADVYSFGMVLLELVSGVRSSNMQGSLVHGEDWYPRWAFDKVFKDMKMDDILDRQIKHCFDNRLYFDFVDRMVKAAIWCLQDRPEARQSIGKVDKMLEGTGNYRT
ncbi:hypothetical protein PVK06_017133 [Gossypium arboreum]|uniref:Protein kinase domain-containing protein n=1 Tax=Gossypium arboreum TaxID=29729 RepID=A0ABR0Q1X2_GOSAR|nr:hypothetical protein PVK06_017133 [Gossypium arboreum]